MMMPASPESLAITLNQTPVGTITRLANDTHIFAFDPEYEADQERPILSLSYKGPMGALVQGNPSRTRLPAFFSNLLPEGYLRDYLASKLRIKSNREFFLLGALGMDLPGAVLSQPLGEMSKDVLEEFGTKSDETRPLRFSLAGVQLKFSAIAESLGTFTIPADGAGGSWIVKLPSERHLQLPEIEYSMLTLAKLIGIEVPEFKLVPTHSIAGLPSDFEKIVADSLAVKRFDRTIHGGRVHMEDFAQVYGIYPQDKYEKAGYAHLAKVLWAEAGEASYTEFIRRLVFTIAIGNGDMHLKNWSLLYTNPKKPVLSPAYDFVPTICFIENDTLALNLGGTKSFFDVTFDKFKKMATSAKAPEKLTLKIVENTIESIIDKWSSNRFDLHLSSSVRRCIDSHITKLLLFKASLVHVRDSFDAELLKNITIAGIDYDPIIDDKTMILEAPTGRTTAVKAPKRMETELIEYASKEGLLPDLAQGPIRVFVGEKLYKEWRRLNFITLEDESMQHIHHANAEWPGRIETFRGNYSTASWMKIVSAHSRQAMEEIDLIQSDGSIRNLKARIQSISEVQRLDDAELTEAAVELKIEDEKTILNPHEGIAYLASDFELKELQSAVEETLIEDRWENSLFSEPKRLVARKNIFQQGADQPVPLEVEIVFQQDVRKTDLLIKMHDLNAELGPLINNEARRLRQAILGRLPPPD